MKFRVFKFVVAIATSFQADILYQSVIVAGFMFSA